MILATTAVGAAGLSLRGVRWCWLGVDDGPVLVLRPRVAQVIIDLQS